MHVVITVSGTTTKIYKNGELAGINTDGAFGGRPFNCEVGGMIGEEFTGTVAFLKIWGNFELKGTNIAKLYAQRDPKAKPKKLEKGDDEEKYYEKVCNAKLI